MNNNYYILRHGQTIHQTVKRGIIYNWPDDDPPCNLTDVGRKQVEKSAKALKSKSIDLIFSSDILRTRQTSEIVSKVLGLNVNYDKRLREINWGIYGGKSALRAWLYYKNPKSKFKKAPPEGESWSDVRKRMVNVIEDLEKKYKGKIILIVSHGDPLWLLEGWFRGLNDNQLLIQKIIGATIKTGEYRQLKYER